MQKMGAEINYNDIIFCVYKDVIKKVVENAKDRNIDIRFASNVEIPAVFEIIQKQAKQKNEKLTIDMYDLMRDGFSKQPKFKILIAVEDFEIIGMLFFFIGYSSFRGKAMYIEELYVEKNYRLKGVSKALIDETLRYADKNDITKIETGLYKLDKNIIKKLVEGGVIPLYEYRIAQLTREEFEKIN
jgi:GNAT superfamily N-acetyltransferase